MFPKVTHLNLYGLFLIRFSITIILLESNILHEFDLVLEYSFQDTFNAICNCGNDVESAINFFRDCRLYSNNLRTLLSSLVNIDHKLLRKYRFFTYTTNTAFNVKENTKIINLTIDFVLSTKRFDMPFLLVVFFLSSLSNNDSSDNKRILSEASPGLLGNQRLYLVAGSYWILPH